MCGYMSDAEYRYAEQIAREAIAARKKREAEAAKQREAFERRMAKRRADEEMREAIAARIEHELDHSAAGKRSTTERVKTRAFA